jgi:precorrin-6B methylase 2
MFGKRFLYWVWFLQKKIKIYSGNELPLEDTEAIQFVSKYIEKGDTVFDIGAHIGLWSGRLRTMVGPRGKVIAFEPIPQTYENFLRFWGKTKLTI